MITLAEFSVEFILPFLGLNNPRIPLQTDEGEYLIRTGSTRLACFRRSLKCVQCGKEGNIFLLQRHQMVVQKVTSRCYIDKNCPGCTPHKDPHMHVMGDHPHLNLYHRDSNKMFHLMTQDHIRPRSKGGASDLSNLQTMCAKCNQEKGSDMFAPCPLQ